MYRRDQYHRREIVSRGNKWRGKRKNRVAQWMATESRRKNNNGNGTRVSIDETKAIAIKSGAGSTKGLQGRE